MLPLNRDHRAFWHQYFSHLSCVIFSGIKNTTVHFYGNDGVCVFKYLVTRDDPQWVFSTIILLINFLCFVFIAASYGYINYKTQVSNRNVGRGTSNSALQAKISAIILTDFFCWIPLSIVSFLHLAKAIDALSWYPFFSILILPINSVLNPLLYDSNFYVSMVRQPTRALSRRVSTMSRRVSTMSRRVSTMTFRSNQPEMPAGVIDTTRQVTAGTPAELIDSSQRETIM